MSMLSKLNINLLKKNHIYREVDIKQALKDITITQALRLI